MWQLVAALLPLCCRFSSLRLSKRKHSGNIFPLHRTRSSMEVPINMSGKPYRSCLIPYKLEIIALRNCRPPTPYARISELLFQKHRLRVRRETIFKFIKVRSHGQKSSIYGKVKPGLTASAPEKSNTAASAFHPKPFKYTYSKRYNLHRLPAEEAEARRKNLEEEGH